MQNNDFMSVKFNDLWYFEWNDVESRSYILAVDNELNLYISNDILRYDFLKGLINGENVLIIDDCC